MKTIFSLILILLVSTGFTEEIPNIAGVWQDEPSETTQQAYLLISQEGTQLTMVHHLIWNGQTFVEEGQGTINESGQIVWKVKVTTQIKGWATEGTHTLSYDPKSQELNGEYLDNKGNKGPLKFMKLLKK